MSELRGKGRIRGLDKKFPKWEFGGSGIIGLQVYGKAVKLCEIDGTLLESAASDEAFAGRVPSRAVGGELRFGLNFCFDVRAGRLQVSLSRFGLACFRTRQHRFYLSIYVELEKRPKGEWRRASQRLSR